MDLRRVAWGGLEVLTVIVVGGLVVGQVVGAPVVFGYVETGSMAPTLAPGDGFVAIPPALAGTPAVGDVVTFRAEELDGGGLTTHRIVGETERGFVTQGDANAFIDQDGQEPPVKEAQVVSVALQVGGNVVVIPHLGTLVTGVQGLFATVQRSLASTTGIRSFLGTQGLAYVILGLSVALYVIDLLLDRGSVRNRDRDRTRSHEEGLDSRLVLGALVAVLVVSATAAMVVPSGTHSEGVVSAEFDSARPTVIPAGESNAIDYQVPNGGVVPMHVYLEPASEGVTVDPHHQYVAGRSSGTATLTLEAPPETGYYRRFVAEHRYLAILPAGTIATLYSVHPWAPILAIDLLLAGAVLLVGRLALSGARIRVRTRDSRHRRSWLGRLRSLVRP